VLVTAGCEVEGNGAFWGKIRNFGLEDNELVSCLRKVEIKLTYQVEDTSGGSLVSGLLAEEQEALASVRGPGCIVVGSGGLLLSAKIAREALGLNGLSTEPEELLLEDKAPRKSNKLVADFCEWVAPKKCREGFADME